MRAATRRRNRSARGFNLVELMVVLIVLGILSMISATSARYVRDRARMGIYYGYIHDIKTAAIRFKNDLGYYPPDVDKDIDPGLINRFGYAAGGHSPAWESLDLSHWNGPYLGYKRWPKNPWGGALEWDYFPDGNGFGGVSEPGIYLTSRPSDAGGREGLPHQAFEERLQANHEDRNTTLGAISLYVGEASATAPSPPAN